MTTNNELWEKARRLFPGGVNSPVRAFRSVGGDPIFFESGAGSRLRSVEGREYIDYVGAWGPQILGHAHPAVTAAIASAAATSTSFGASSLAELELAERIMSALPSIEVLRFVNSGTEATMSALRLCRGFTGRNKIVKFAGCYHGHADFLLVKAGSGALTFGAPDSLGVPASFAAETIVCRFNDLADVEKQFATRGGEIAGVIVEPVVGNMGVVPPKKGFLDGLRSLTARHGALLVFDEVMTGFRVARGCAQSIFGVTPDLTCLGKIIGGGLPIGAYGGRREIMEKLSPVGGVYQAGTNSGNPVVMAAGVATLDRLDDALYRRLESTSARLADGLSSLFGGRAVLQRAGSMMTLFFLTEPGRSIDSADDLCFVDTKRYAAYFHHMLDNGVYPPPSAFEAFFVSAAHSDDDIAATLESAERFAGK